MSPEVLHAKLDSRSHTSVFLHFQKCPEGMILTLRESIMWSYMVMGMLCQRAGYLG